MKVNCLPHKGEEETISMRDLTEYDLVNDWEAL